MKKSFDNLDVFVLTYNRSDMLKIMLESLCMQSAEGFHIKVLNNASTDNTEREVAAIAKIYPDRDIECLTWDKNLGNYGNFIKSQEIAQNEYTAVFHDDDAVDPEYIYTAMTILEKNKEIGMCSGGVVPYWNVSNSNWDILNKDYWLYSKGKGTWLNLLMGRPMFATNIYKTAIYKSVKYRPDLYGKLHDIVFMCEINEICDIAFVRGVCLRWRQSATHDSACFSNGPFPDEVANTINKLSSLMKDNKSSLRAPLLWNFAYFLYWWSNLKTYETWYEFSQRLISTKYEKRAFSRNQVKMLSFKPYIEMKNRMIRKCAAKTGKQIYVPWENRL